MTTAAVTITCRNIFIYPIIPFNQLGKPQVLQLTVGFRGIDKGPGDDLSNRLSAVRTSREGRILQGLPHLKNRTPGAGLPDMFIFINRHEPSLFEVPLAAGRNLKLAKKSGLFLLVTDAMLFPTNIAHISILRRSPCF